MELISPTDKTYKALLYAYEFFNQELFDSTLPGVVFTYHRQNRVMGYASFERWVDAQEKYFDELAINPEYFAQYPLIEICQTLVHEMVHIWQTHRGTPGRRGYHNTQWANKMEAVGLMPSSTGKPGGKTTGEAMMDYVLVQGRFIDACRTLLKRGFSLPLVDRYPVFRREVPILAYEHEGKEIELTKQFFPKPAKTVQKTEAVQFNNAVSSELNIESQVLGDLNDISITGPLPAFLTTKPKSKSGRLKYSCKSCQANVWAKPGLNLGCLDCNVKFQEED